MLKIVLCLVQENVPRSEKMHVLHGAASAKEPLENTPK